VLDALGLEHSRLLINLSHTHAGPSINTDDIAKPGGSLVRPYRDAVAQAAAAAAREALATNVEATLAWTAGRCDLAQNRDLFHRERHVCGFNPSAGSDDTLLVGRVTSASGKPLATIVNYACHPTTLAWENRQISPDFVGAMRELVEAYTEQAPCLFLQGASAELAPREQYTGDTAIADKNGRALGFAVLAALEGMLPPGMHLEYSGIVESGTALAVWRRTAHQASHTLRATCIDVEFELKELPSLTELEQRWGGVGERALNERLARGLQVRQGLGDSDASKAPLWLWQVGEALVVAQPNEAYSWLQTELRQSFNGRPVVVMNLTGHSGRGYLPREALYDHDDLYQVWQTPWARGSLERLLAAAKAGIAEHLLDPPEG
jgi:hypothetical protein